MTRETAVVVLVPEAEPLVAPWRERYDPSAADGMPAHVTLLYPFIDTTGGEGLGTLAKIAAKAQAFDVTFAATARFGEQVLFLDPEPDGPLRALIATLAETFGLQPYGGTIPLAEVKPHLTVVDGRPDVMDEADAALRAALPIRTRVTAITLMELGRRWHTRASFHLRA